MVGAVTFLHPILGIDHAAADPQTAQAKLDLTTAYTEMTGRTCDETLAPALGTYVRIYAYTSHVLEGSERREKRMLLACICLS